MDGENDTPITWAAYLYARGNPVRYTDPSGQCTFDDSAKKCATEIAGGVVGAIGLTTVQSVKGAIDTAKAGASLLADLGRGAMGDPGAQQRNRARLAQAGEVVHTLGAVAKDPGKALAALKRAAAEIDNEARRVEQEGDVFTAAMLRGNYAGKIGLAAATLPKALREVSDLLVDAGKKAAEAGKEQARRLAARDPVSRANTPTRPTETARATVEIPESASLSVREGQEGLRHEIVPKAERRVLAEQSAGKDGAGGGGVANEAASLIYKPTSGILLQAQEGRTTTILGSYNNDMRSVVNELGNVKSTDFGPRVGGFNILNVPDNLYVTPKQFWTDYNQPWLSNSISRGDNFLMATRPAFEVADVKTGFSVLARPNPVTGKMELSGFGREYLEMKRAGYMYQNGAMVK